ncbi:MAG: ATP-binding cassette domain-containing protein [Proteobacteria bacterium]|nr:ATP-binding cassette domain-containing protein [Pseudomonadota bacterium]
MSDIVLSASDLTKRYGSFTAVDGISFEVREGECFGFLGPNGAGKTTTMRMITNHVPVTEGSLTVLGMEVMANAREVKSRIGVVPQDNNLDTDLRVLENLLVYSRYHAIDRKAALERAGELLAFFQLAEHAQSPIDRLSGGMQRRLLIVRGLINEPELLILDEPTTGLDPQARHVIWQKLRALKSQGVTLVLTTHYMEEAERLCDRLVILDHGRILVEGSPKDLIEKHAGSDVVEIRLEEGESAGDCLKALGGQVPDGTVAECSADTLYLYAPDGGKILEQIRIESGRTFLRRRATLEDVFLRLTGRELRE